MRHRCCRPGDGKGHRIRSGVARPVHAFQCFANTLRISRAARHSGCASGLPSLDWIHLGLPPATRSKRNRGSAEGAVVTCAGLFTYQRWGPYLMSPHLRAFYQRLLARGKAPLQTVVGVMRKLLHAFFAMFRSDHSCNGSRLCRTADFGGNDFRDPWPGPTINHGARPQ